MMSTQAAALRQRAEYTHKFNAMSGRHGWLRLTPAYSVKVVEEIIARYPAATRVLDPFCGTGTTVLSAASHGLDGATTDINPFLIWLAKTKTRNYSANAIHATLYACDELIELAENGKYRSEVPPIHKIERWWTSQSLDFLCGLKGGMDRLDKPNGPTADLLKIAFCRTLIKLSKAAFNHQSMSFRDSDPQLDLDIDRGGIFRSELDRVLNSASEKMSGAAEIVLHDARRLDAEKLGKFDLVITSPPYANRMSYIRELRPYMYWLGYLSKAREAGDLDWKAIGGTWGVATSRLSEWAAETEFANPHLSDVIAAIGNEENKNGALLANYVEKYFDDIFIHLGSLAGVLNPGAGVHYIVGNSTFYGTLVKVEEIYRDIMKMVGFSKIQITPIRKRNSKKELIEFDVSAVFKGK